MASPDKNNEKDHEPNEQGFAGDAKAPKLSSAEISEGESIAIPAGDLTQALTDGVDQAMERRRDKGGSSTEDDEPHEKRHLFRRHHEN